MGDSDSHNRIIVMMSGIENRTNLYSKSLSYSSCFCLLQLLTDWFDVVWLTSIAHVTCSFLNTLTASQERFELATDSYFEVVDMDGVRIHNNSRWFGRPSASELMRELLESLCRWRLCHFEASRSFNITSRTRARTCFLHCPGLPAFSIAFFLNSTIPAKLHVRWWENDETCSVLQRDAFQSFFCYKTKLKTALLIQRFVLPRDATQSAIMPQYVVCPSVRQSVRPSVRDV